MLPVNPKISVNRTTSSFGTQDKHVYHDRQLSFLKSTVRSVDMARLPDHTQTNSAETCPSHPDCSRTNGWLYHQVSLRHPLFLCNLHKYFEFPSSSVCSLWIGGVHRP